MTEGTKKPSMEIKKGTQKSIDLKTHKEVVTKVAVLYMHSY